MVILIFGASITWGAWDKEQGGWANRLKLYFDRQTIDSNFDNKVYVYPLGVSGDTSEDLSKRFKGEIEDRIEEDQDTLIIFSVGLNDSQVNLAPNQNRVSNENYEKNIKQLTDIASKFTKKILIVGLTPVNESKVNPTPWIPNWGYTNEQIEKYNKILANICKINSLGFIDILAVFSKQSGKLLSSDGLHPNSEGHKLIFNLLKNYIVDNQLL